MRRLHLIPLLALVLAVSGLAGCLATGSVARRSVAIDSTPQGAHCEFMRANINWGGTDTPGILLIPAGRGDIQMVCSKDGYRDALLLIHSDPAAWEVSDLVLPMAATLKAVKGTSNTYKGEVHVELRPADD